MPLRARRGSFPPPSGSLLEFLRAASDDESASGRRSEAGTTPTSSTDGHREQSVKRSRYLREADRRDIIRRIDRGEKQAALAKEYGVTRAAICHINKNRVEIMTRSARSDVHAAARHPKRGMYTTSKSSVYLHELSHPGFVDGRVELPMVYEVRSLALTVHLTALRDQDTDCRQFRAMADRAFRVLLEEALAAVPVRQVELVTPSGVSCQGVVAAQPTCAIFMSECGYPMLEAFRCIQPDSPTGFMTLDQRESSPPNQRPHVTLRKMCAPLDLRCHNILLLDATCASADEVSVAIQSLLDFGAEESSIFFVTLIISVVAVSDICEQFPQVHIVTAAIDPEVTASQTISPGVGNFQERYFNTTTIRQSDLGSNVDL